MSFFDKLKRGLSKTKDGLLKQIDGIFRSFVHVDEDMLEELEELLITADVGVGPTEKIVDALRERIKDDRISEPEAAKATVPMSSRRNTNLSIDIAERSFSNHKNAPPREMPRRSRKYAGIRFRLLRGRPFHPER